MMAIAPDRAIDLEHRRHGDQREHDDLERHEGADEQDEKEGAGPFDVPQRQRVAGDRWRARSTAPATGTGCRPNSRSPTLSPSQVMPEQAVFQA